MPLHLDAWTGPDRGALFVISGASGSGKTTLLKELLSRMPEIGFSVSATTRDARLGELDGRDYHFVGPERFLEMVDAGELLEWARVYDRSYGTPRAPVLAALAEGRSLILDIDVQGARQVREALPEAVSIFVLPPDPDVLETRLRSRGTDSEEVIRSRMRQLMEQLGACGEFDYLVVNDHLATAFDCLQAVVVAELQRSTRRSGLIGRMTGARG